jgi:dTDP-glucose 4,6-dehydratase
LYDNVVVTGGLGFIGSNYILHAIKSSELGRITNIDSLSYGSNPDNLREVENTPTYKFAKADLADPQIIMSEVANADIVAHFAAESHVDRSISDPRRFLQSNVVGTFNLLEAARHGKVCKFIHTCLH